MSFGFSACFLFCSLDSSVAWLDARIADDRASDKKVSISLEDLRRGQADLS